VASIRKRRDRKGGWIVDYRDLPGGRRETVKTRELAKALRADRVKEAQQAQPAPQDRDITLNDYADRWLEQIVASVEPTTSASYRQNLAKHIRPVFGPVKLRALHRGHVKALLAKKRTEGLSKNSVRLIRSTLSVMLGDAVDDAVLQVNPAVGTGRRGRKRPDTIGQAERQKKIRTMTYEQLATFLAVSEARCSRREHVLFLLLADAGLRPGEVCGVHWANFDAVAQTLHAERAVTNSGRIKTTKTGEARTVDLSSRLVSALTDLRSHLEAEAVLAGKEGIGPWIFENVGGHGAKADQPIRPRRIGKLFGWVLRNAALPHFVLYDLRHSFASHLIASGATIDYVSKQLGHASPAMTLSVYTHFFPKGDRRHIERMEQVRSAASVKWAPALHDDVGLPVGARRVNENSWHRFGTTDEDRETGESEVLEFSGAEGGIRSGHPQESLDSRRVPQRLSRLLSAWGVTWSDTKIAQLSLAVLPFYSRSSDPTSGSRPGQYDGLAGRGCKATYMLRGSRHVFLSSWIKSAVGDRWLFRPKVVANVATRSSCIRGDRPPSDSLVHISEDLPR
jgi:integrase